MTQDSLVSQKEFVLSGSIEVGISRNNVTPLLVAKDVGPLKVSVFQEIPAWVAFVVRLLSVQKNCAPENDEGPLNVRFPGAERLEGCTTPKMVAVPEMVPVPWRVAFVCTVTPPASVPPCRVTVAELETETAPVTTEVAVPESL